MKKDISISAEFVVTVQKAEHVLARSAAIINNCCRAVERTSAHADDDVVKETIVALREVAGDLSEAWQELDLDLAAHDLAGL